MVVSSSWVRTRPQEALHADVETKFIFRCQETLCALILVDELSNEGLVDGICPMWAWLSLLCHFKYFGYCLQDFSLDIFD